MTHPVNQAVDAVVIDAIINQPRSQQTLIGPSEIGTDCLRCLARKLAGIKKLPLDGIHDVPWLPFIGTSMHAMLEEFFKADNAKKGEERWLVESRLNIGTIGDNAIAGSCDLFDTHTVQLLTTNLWAQLNSMLSARKMTLVQPTVYRLTCTGWVGPMLGTKSPKLR
jgi:hypothetical protein